MIALVALVGLLVVGGGSCAVCVAIAKFKEAEDTSSTYVPPAVPTPVFTVPTTTPTTTTTTASAPTRTWITSDHPPVKFLAPLGWKKELKDDWGVFKSPDGQAVFAFTTFNRPRESTIRLNRAADVLGVMNERWRPPTRGTLGADGFPARMAEGTCSFRGPGGRIWYATVDSGTSDQILLIYAVSAEGRDKHLETAAASVKSLQRR